MSLHVNPGGADLTGLLGPAKISPSLYHLRSSGSDAFLHSTHFFRKKTESFLPPDMPEVLRPSLMTPPGPQPPARSPGAVEATPPNAQVSCPPSCSQYNVPLDGKPRLSHGIGWTAHLELLLLSEESPPSSSQFGISK